MMGLKGTHDYEERKNLYSENGELMVDGIAWYHLPFESPNEQDTHF